MQLWLNISDPFHPHPPNNQIHHILESTLKGAFELSTPPSPPPQHAPVSKRRCAGLPRHQTMEINLNLAQTSQHVKQTTRGSDGEPLSACGSAHAAASKPNTRLHAKQDDPRGFRVAISHVSDGVNAGEVVSGGQFTSSLRLVTSS